MNSIARVRFEIEIFWRVELDDRTTELMFSGDDFWPSHTVIVQICIIHAGLTPVELTPFRDGWGEWGLGEGDFLWGKVSK